MAVLAGKGNHTVEWSIQVKYILVVHLEMNSLIRAPYDLQSVVFYNLHFSKGYTIKINVRSEGNYFWETLSDIYIHGLN